MTLAFAWKYRASNKAATTPRLVALHQDRGCGVDHPDPDHHRPGLHHLQLHPQAGPVPSAGFRREAGAIEVVALDWKWLFIYPEQGIATVNKIVFPANTRSTSGSPPTP
jgi:cytochrome o ubiquinol oxidase subunit 2